MCSKGTTANNTLFINVKFAKRVDLRRLQHKKEQTVPVSGKRCYLDL